jgi:formate/nitrite transporter
LPWTGAKFYAVPDFLTAVLKGITNEQESMKMGNFVGSILLAVVVWQTGLLGSAGNLNSMGELAHKVSQAKIALPFAEAFFRGILCNILVILAVILATIAKDIISKIACCCLPVLVFVACGFEHCVANMYLVNLGLLAEGASLTELAGAFRNIFPVTLGNIVGGMFILWMHPNRIRQFRFLR